MEFVSPFTAGQSDQRLEPSADSIPTHFSMADDSLFDDSLDDEFHSKVLKSSSSPFSGPPAHETAISNPTSEPALSHLDDSIGGAEEEVEEEEEEEGGAIDPQLIPPLCTSPPDSKSTVAAPSLVSTVSANCDHPTAPHSALQTSPPQEVPTTSYSKKATGKVVPSFGKKKAFVPPAAKSTPNPTQSTMVNAKKSALGKEEEEEEERKSAKDSMSDSSLLKLGSDSDSTGGARREIESKEDKNSGTSEAKETRQANQKNKRAEQEAKKLEREEKKRDRELKKLEKEQKKAEKERQREEKRLELERKRAEREQSKMGKELKRKKTAGAKGTSTAKGETNDSKPVTSDTACMQGDIEGEEVTDIGPPAATVSSPYKQSPARDTMAEMESETDDCLQHEEKNKEANKMSTNRKPVLAPIEERAASLDGTNQTSASRPNGPLDSARKPKNMSQDRRKKERGSQRSESCAKQRDRHSTGKSSSKISSTKDTVPNDDPRACRKSHGNAGSNNSGRGEGRVEDTTRERRRSKPRNFSGPVWVQCTKCDKWRQLRACQDPAVLPEDWECRMDIDSTCNSCSAAEEPWSDPGDSQEFVESSFVPGSIVWAKMDGYPWWPAMVEEDPDEETYFRMEDGSLVPVEYHVVFFDTPVSRVWVTSSHLQLYTVGSDMNKEHKLVVPHKHSRGLRAALKMAVRAGQLGIPERLASFTFSKRFKEGRGAATLAGKKRRRCDMERRGARKSANLGSSHLVAGEWLSRAGERGGSRATENRGGGKDGGGGGGPESENGTAIEPEVDVVA